MKKIICFTMFAVFFVAVAFAGSAVPTADGNDVIVPVALIATISDNPAEAKVVAVMHDAKGAGHEIAMTFNGTDFVAPGARGADFHPAVKDGNAYKWAKIEEVWDTGASFVKWRPAGPCLHID